MAKDKSDANLEAGKGQTFTDQGNANETNYGQVDIDKLIKENEGLKQAQSTLTKSNEELKADLAKIKEGLGAVVGVTSEEKPTTEVLLQNALEKINKLEKETQKARSRSLLENVVNNYRDGDKELDPKVKEFLKAEIEVDEPNEDLIKERVSQKFQSLKSLLSGSSSGQKQPDIKTTAGSLSRNPTANEILGL